MSQPHADRHEPVLNVPPVTGWLLASIVLAHLARQLLDPRADAALMARLALIPAALTGPQAGAAEWLRLLSFQFLHAGWVHLAVNGFTLLAFGAAVERRVLGGWRLAALYLLCGALGGLAQVAVEPGSAGSVVGASAGISGLFGIVVRGLTAQGDSRRTLLMAGFWVAVMAATGATPMPGTDAPVAWVAHIGGFLAGLILLPLARPRVPRE